MIRASLPTSSPHEDGFSLIETVAALAILAMAALPLMQVASDATRNTGYLEQRFLARTVASNVLAEALANPRPIGTLQTRGEAGQLGRSFAWQMVVTPTGQGGLTRLDVYVRRNGEEQVIAHLSTLKSTRPGQS